MKTTFVRLSVVVATLFIGFTAQAQFATGPSAKGMGNAGRAAVDEGEVPLMNPASLASIRKYYPSLFYGFGSDKKLGDINEWGLQIADGTEGSFFPGALGYFRRTDDYPGVGSNLKQDFQLSFGNAPINKLGWGVTVHRQSDNPKNAFGDKEQVQWNGHVGVIYAPLANFGVGFTVHDFMPGKDSVPSELRQSAVYGAGVNYEFENFFNLRADISKRDSGSRGRFDVGLGMESTFAEWVALRVGYNAQASADRDWVTAGIAYKGPRLSLEYSFQKDVRSGDNSRHLIDLWMPL